MTFFLIYLEVAANRVSPQVSALDSFSKVLTLYSTITLPTIFHSCFYNQLSGQTCISTSKYLPHLVRYLSVFLWNYFLAHFIFFSSFKILLQAYFFHVVFLKKKKLYSLIICFSHFYFLCL